MPQNQVGWVYPRACGGTGRWGSTTCTTMGLSPRVRGNHNHVGHQNSRHRSIPARAGEPSAPIADRKGNTVYPRACGGTRYIPDNPPGQLGLSPRVRGNHSFMSILSKAIESIPARAGEPSLANDVRGLIWVYPRACGGTPDVSHREIKEVGLSPRVRGNLPGAGCKGRAIRSIPARAGEPSRGRVYR